MKLQQLAALSLCGFIAACSQNSPPPTQVVADSNYNANWEFFRSEKALDLTGAQQQIQWEKVQLPHTPKIEPLIVNDQFQGDAWYKKNITIDPKYKGKQDRKSVV